MDMNMKCGRCGNFAPMDSFKLVPGTNMLVCGECIAQLAERKVTKERARLRPIIISKTDDQSHEKPLVKEKKRLLEAAMAGNAEAQFELGKLFEARNPVEAIKWHNMAAKQGHRQATMHAAVLEFNRAKIYDVGTPHKKVSTAIKWYRQAAEHGHAEAQTRLNEILSEKQRRKAQEAARLAKIARLEEEYENLLVERDAAQSEITYDYFSNDEDGHLISDRLWESETQDRLIAIEKELVQLRNKK